MKGRLRRRPRLAVERMLPAVLVEGAFPFGYDNRRHRVAHEARKTGEGRKIKARAVEIKKVASGDDESDDAWRSCGADPRDRMCYPGAQALLWTAELGVRGTAMMQESWR